ncbi:MAG: hypothetical protein HY677_01080 [Chloroflexi bacterium]|nr:hypothetical protein [Chloroflexota bacterium]
MEEQRKQRPEDKAIATKLAVARASLTYRQGMKQVEAEWPTATAASTIQGWSKAVEVLEGLYVQPQLTGYKDRIVEKLYAAHLNYGKALQAAGRNYEALGQYQRALQIDKSRPEALDALKQF